jgi:hypothetical protein
MGQRGGVPPAEGGERKIVGTVCPLEGHNSKDQPWSISATNSRADRLIPGIVVATYQGSALCHSRSMLQAYSSRACATTRLGLSL